MKGGTAPRNGRRTAPMEAPPATLRGKGASAPSWIECSTDCAGRTTGRGGGAPTVQGPVKKQLPDGMSHRGHPPHTAPGPTPPPLKRLGQFFFRAFGR